MHPWISRTLDFWLQFGEKKCSLSMDVYGSSSTETNQEVTKRGMEAIVADHMGTEKCPWSAAEM